MCGPVMDHFSDPALSCASHLYSCVENGPCLSHKFDEVDLEVVTINDEPLSAHRVSRHWPDGVEMYSNDFQILIEDQP